MVQRVVSEVAWCTVKEARAVAVWSQIGELPVEEVARIAWRDTSEQLRHPVPISWRHDPDAI